MENSLEVASNSESPRPYSCPAGGVNNPLTFRALTAFPLPDLSVGSGRSLEDRGLRVWGVKGPTRSPSVRVRNHWIGTEDSVTPRGNPHRRVRWTRRRTRSPPARRPIRQFVL